MNINYLLSETTNAASSAAIREIVKKAENDSFSNIVVIVPETKSIAIEREILDVSKKGVFANVFVYSFVRLLNRIGGIDESKLISKQTSVMLLRKIIIDNASNLCCYKKTAKSVGFPEKIYETIQQIKSSGLNLEDIRQLAENSTGALKQKMKDVCTLYSAYQDAISGCYLDDCDRLRKLGELAKTSEFIKQSKIYVVGFDNVTSDMIGVLKEFATHAKEITFSCCFFNSNRKDKYIQNNELYKKFTRVAEELKYPYVPRFVAGTYKDDFWHLQNELFVPGKEKKLPARGNVSLLEFDNKNAEICFVANRIIEEVRAGKRFRDFAVVSAEFEKDSEMIEKIFRSFEIPCFVSRAYGISNHFFIEFIKNSFEMVLSGYSAENTLKWLANAFFDQENYAEFKNYVDGFGINHGGFFDTKNLENVEDELVCARIKQSIDVICDFEKSFGEEIKNAKYIKNYIKIIENLSKKYEIEQKLTKIADIEKENNLTVESEITSGIFAKFEQINKSICEFLGDTLASANEFLQIYLTSFSEENINLIPLSVDCVLVQNNTDGLYGIKELFIVGANEDNFPNKMQDSGILQDDEIDELSKITNKNIEPKVVSINKRALFCVFEQLLVPSEKLYISYSKRSYSSTNSASKIMKKITGLFNIKIEENKFLKIQTKNNAEKVFAKHVGEYLSGESFNAGALNLEYNKLRKNFTKSFEKYINNLCFGEKNFKIDNASDLFFANNKTSVTQFETYFACPYRFFFKYGLRLKENKVAKLSSLDVGTLIHKFVEIFTDRINEFEDLSDEEFDRRAKEIFDETLTMLSINKKKNVAIISFVLGECVRLAKYLFEEQCASSFKNDSKLNEFEFKGKNAIKIPIDENKVILVEGKIDRIDKFGDYIRIIDYKTGETSSDLSSIYFGKKIQLVSYLSACESFENKKVAGLLYFPIHSEFVKIEQKIKNNYKMEGFLLNDIQVIKYMDSSLSLDNSESRYVPIKLQTNTDVQKTGELKIADGRTKVFMSAEEFENVKRYSKQLCRQAAIEILDGNIAPAPFAKQSERESGLCEYCELSGFCGKEHARFGAARRCLGKVELSSFDKEGEN